MRCEDFFIINLILIQGTIFYKIIVLYKSCFFFVFLGLFWMYLLNYFFNFFYPYDPTSITADFDAAKDLDYGEVLPKE